MKIMMLGGNTKEEVEKRLQIVASAGGLSRFDGTVSQVFENNNDYEKNLKLAKIVLGYGHRSVAEHDYLVFALEDVTPIVEQTLIGYRLTSFTVKSRRNVDFRNVGFYVPDFRGKDGQILENNEALQDTYKKYMKSLFNKYGQFVDMGLPLEDCRYILPYSYYSNFIMGCDAHEFLKMVSDLLYGKNSHIAELKALGEEFYSMIENYVPYLKPSLDKENGKKEYDNHYAFVDDVLEKAKEDSLVSVSKMLDKKIDGVHLIDYTNNADWEVLCRIIMNKYQVTREDAAEILRVLGDYQPGVKRKLMQALLHTKNQRELEAVYYSFEFSISLAVLTRLTRNRMHSLLTPDFVPLWNFENYVTPVTLENQIGDEYHNVFYGNKMMVEYFKEQGVCEEDLVYFYLSGNSCNVCTTINARGLEWLSRVRNCNKAQWEIRDITKKMVEETKKVSPLIGECLGPSCQVLGECPEGKDSCKNRGVVVKKLKK